MSIFTQLLDRVKAAVQNFGPGLFIIGYVVGTGSVTSMVVSGAKFGLSLSWALLLSCFFTYYLLVAISKLTLVSGETLMYNFRKAFGSPVTIFIIAALTTTIVSSLIGIMGVVAEVVVEWVRINTGFANLSRVVVALVFIAILIGLFWSGKHKNFINAMSFLVALMSIGFIITSVMVVSQADQDIAAFFPSTANIPNTGLVVAGMVGTTMAGVCLASRSILVQEQGWTREDLRRENKDASISMVMTFLISFAIMVSATGTLYFTGTSVEDPTDMMYALGPWAGDFALTLFTVGIVGAALSSIFPNLLLFPWLMADYTHGPRDMRRPLVKGLVILIALTCLVMPVFGGKPVWILIASQAVSPLVMPLITLFLILLLNRKDIMGEHTSSRTMNIMLGITLIFNCYMLYVAFKGFVDFF